MGKKYYAHTVEGKPPEEWQPLEEHLRNAAELARPFVDQFGSGDWLMWRDCGMIWGSVHTKRTRNN